VQLINKINGLVATNEGINFGITIKNSDELIGTIGLFNFKKEHHRCEIGYLLNPAFHRQGIMNEAIKEVLRFGFEKLQLHSIEAVIDPKNIASVSILEKNNFVKEAYFKEDFYYEGKFLDSEIYSLLTSSYRH
jgi:ribosomal-protein-alanine N-acetyltransferase